MTAPSRSTTKRTAATTKHATHATTAEPAHASTTEAAPQPAIAPPPPPSLTTQASGALASLKALSSSLPIDDALPPKELAAAKVSNRVPLEVMTIASSVLNEDPTQYPQFDATGAKAAVDYEQAMAPVAQAAQVLSSRIEKSILKRRSTMATQALALYAVMKGASRLPANEATRTQVKTMKALLTVKPKSRATAVTQKETQQVTKVMRSQKKAKAAQAELDAASGKAALANAEAATQVAANADLIPQAPTPPAPSAQPASPPAAAPAPVSVTPSH
jgi:hypothetical protein